MSGSNGGLDAARRWLFLTGNRTAIAGGLLLGILCLTGALVAANVVRLGPGSNLMNSLSGLISGLLTLLTVTLAINQLVLSRVFGSPGGLTSKLDGALQFRRRIEEIAGVASNPSDPGDFLGLVADALVDRAAELETAVKDAEFDRADAFESYATDLTSYAEKLKQARDSDNTSQVLAVALDTEYADQITRTRELRAEHGERLPAGASEQLGALLELLKAVATMRQFFKTVAIQQDLARLSRRLIYTGVVAVLVTLYLWDVHEPVGGAADGPVRVSAVDRDRRDAGDARAAGGVGLAPAPSGDRQHVHRLRRFVRPARVPTQVGSTDARASRRVGRRERDSRTRRPSGTWTRRGNVRRHGARTHQPGVRRRRSGSRGVRLRAAQR